MTRPTLTAEQKKFMKELDAKHEQFIEGIKAEMIAQNEKVTMPTRIILNVSHDDTTLLRSRLPIAMIEAIHEMDKELNASHSYIVYHLLRYAITSGFTDQMEGIVRLSSFQQYRNTFKN